MVKFTTGYIYIYIYIWVCGCDYVTFNCLYVHIFFSNPRQRAVPCTDLSLCRRPPCTRGASPFYFQFPAFSCAALNAWQQWKCEANALCTCTMMKLQATRGSNEQKQIILKTLQPTSAFLLQHTFNMNVTVIKKSKYNYWAVWWPLYWETTKNPMSSIPWESLFSWPWCQAFRLITVDKMGIKAVCNYLCSPMGNGNILRELRSYFAYNWLQGYITRCSELPLFFSAPFLLRKYIILYKMCHLQHEEVLHVIFIDTSNLESEFLPQWHT